PAGRAASQRRRYGLYRRHSSRRDLGADAMTEDIAGRRIVITGGAGFIGHHMALKLKKLGANVDVIDGLQVNNLSAFAGNADNISNRALYLHVIHERLDLLHAAGIPVHVIDARDYQTFSPL